MRLPFQNKPDHSRAPVLDALHKFRERGDIVYGPPGHKQGRGVDPRVLEIVGPDVFASDVLIMNGLDDRRQSQGVLDEAEALMADAVHAEQAFFSTCGSSLSIKSAMMAVAGPGEKILISRNAHKSVVSSLILSGHVPVWVHPKWDDDLGLAHPPEPTTCAAPSRRTPRRRRCCSSRRPTGVLRRTSPASPRCATSSTPPFSWTRRGARTCGCRPAACRPARISRWSAFTRWAWPSSRVRCFISRATASIRPCCRSAAICSRRRARAR